MSDNLRLYTKALYGFDHVVRLVPPDAWESPSPCEQWTARDVLGHVNGVQRYLHCLVEGLPVTIDPMTQPGRTVGDDPADTWSATRDAVLACLDRPGVLHREVDSFWGRKRVDEVLGFNVGDSTVHSWDLARAVGVDERLDPELVSHAERVLRPVAPGLVETGVLAPARPVRDGADPQVSLLALAGRTP